MFVFCASIGKPNFMKQIFFVLIFTGHSMISTFGQQKNTSGQHRLYPDDKSYSIGINTQFALDGLLDQSIHTPLEVLLRRQVKKGQAFRARIKGMTWHTDRKEGDEGLETHLSQLALALGYEWHQPIGNRFGFYYGLELEKGFNQNKSIHSTITPSSIGDYYLVLIDNEKVHRYSILPVAGVTYQPIKNLYISA